MVCHLYLSLVSLMFSPQHLHLVPVSLLLRPRILSPAIIAVADNFSSYAIQCGLKIKSKPKHRGLVEFADGSSEETLGHVNTSWTFESGKRIN